MRFKGVIEVVKAGKYKFYTQSEDGSSLYINSKLVVNNDGIHGFKLKEGTVRLSMGQHHIEASPDLPAPFPRPLNLPSDRQVIYFYTWGMVRKGLGGSAIKAFWSGPGIPKEVIPESVFVSHANNAKFAATVRQAELTKAFWFAAVTESKRSASLSEEVAAENVFPELLEEEDTATTQPQAKQPLMKISTKRKKLSKPARVTKEDIASLKKYHHHLKQSHAAMLQFIKEAESMPPEELVKQIWTLTLTLTPPYLSDRKRHWRGLGYSLHWVVCR